MNIIMTAVNKTNLLYSLEITWKGMLAIFLVMGIIYVVIIILNKVTAVPAEKVKAFFGKIFSPFVRAWNALKKSF